MSYTKHNYDSISINPETGLTEKVFRKYGRTYIQKVAILYSIKKNGERYANPTEYELAGMEKTIQDVIKRLEQLNPGRKYEIA